MTDQLTLLSTYCIFCKGVARRPRESIAGMVPENVAAVAARIHETSKLTMTRDRFAATQGSVQAGSMYGGTHRKSCTRQEKGPA